LPLSDLARRFPEVPVVRRLADLVPSGTLANADVSTFSRDLQVRLKLFEIVECSFVNYEFFFDNILPFRSANEDLIQAIARQNSVRICDTPGLLLTREAILRRLEEHGIHRRSYVWEALKFKHITTELNRLRKKHPCKLCNGKGRFEVESPDETIDVAVVPCSACRGQGVSESGMNCHIQGIPARTFLFGPFGELGFKEAPEIADLLPMLKVSEVRKPALMSLLGFISNANVTSDDRSDRTRRASQSKSLKENNLC
jgi:hypothetical protein